MRDPHKEFLRFHYGEEAGPQDTSNLTDIELIRADIDTLHKKVDMLVVEIKTVSYTHLTLPTKA